MRHRWLRRTVATIGGIAIVIGIAGAGLSWRLARGPISLAFFTPIFAKAIQQNFGGEQRVDVGGTTIERDKNGHTSLRLINVVLHDQDGGIVASAAKVEVGISPLSLLTGNLHASSLRLVEAEISVRIETDGRIDVFTGGNARPIAVAPPRPVSRSTSHGTAEPASAPPNSKTDAATAPAATPALVKNGAEGIAALFAWIDGLGHGGLDGHELSEIGLLDGTLDVDDRREGRHWRFENIDVSLNRPGQGAVEFVVRSEAKVARWSIRAAAARIEGGRHTFSLAAERVPAKDLLLALRFADLPVTADLPISARVHGEIGPTGVPDVLQGAIVAEDGFISKVGAAQPIPVEHATINFEWNAAQRTVLVPMQIAAAGNRYTLLGQIGIPKELSEPWQVQLGGGSAVLSSGIGDDPPVVLNRIMARGRIDFPHHSIELLSANLGNSETGIALSGRFDYSGQPRLTLGLAARRMSLATMEGLWPGSVNPSVRAWVDTHVSAATIERIDIAINAPLDTLAPHGPPVPQDGLAISLKSSGTTLRPVDSLPGIHDADLDVTVSGRDVTVKVGHGTVLLPSGRKLMLSDGAFVVPDTVPKPTPAQTRFRVDGPVAAVAELLAMDGLRKSDVPLDPATSRGNVTAQVALGVLLSEKAGEAETAYSVEADFTNFAAERMIAGQRLEASTLHARADNNGYEVTGDVKIAGASASLDYRQRYGETGADLRVQGVLDEAARTRLGINLGPGLSGAIPIKLAGHIGAGKNGQFTVDADLTSATVDELLPGWEKPAGKPARASFTLLVKPTTTRLENITLDGSGTVMRGDVQLDSSGNLVTASFPVFSPRSGDKVSLKADRASDGTIHVVLHGDVYDGRQFVKSAMAGPSLDINAGRHKLPNLDVDLKLGAIAGFQGEALRSAELKLSRRGGQIRRFALSARIGRNGILKGELRPNSNGRPTILVQTDDAGALFRFTDMYGRLVGGRLSLSMDAPSGDDSPQQGTVEIDRFGVRGEAALNQVAAGMAPSAQSSVQFSAMQVAFTRTPGKLSIHDGVVRGPVIGATIEGVIDYRHDNVRMHGTFVPLYGLNTMFGRLPIVGQLLGGDNEGLVGITYEVVGSPSAPVLRVNPISAVAPGFTRKLFEFQDGGPGGADAFQSTR